MRASDRALRGEGSEILSLQTAAKTLTQSRIRVSRMLFNVETNLGILLFENTLSGAELEGGGVGGNCLVVENVPHASRCAKAEQS